MLVVAGLLAASPTLVVAESARLSPGTQVATSTVVKVIDADGHEREATFRYFLFVPADYAADETKRWPLVLFLHGSGERGDDLELVKKHGPPKFLDSKPDFPAVVISPQCPKDKRWNAAELAKLVDSIANNLRIDRQRLYVTGLSMGGLGTPICNGQFAMFNLQSFEPTMKPCRSIANCKLNIANWVCASLFDHASSFIQPSEGFRHVPARPVWPAPFA